MSEIGNMAATDKNVYVRLNNGGRPDVKVTTDSRTVLWMEVGDADTMQSPILSETPVSNFPNVDGIVLDTDTTDWRMYCAECDSFVGDDPDSVSPGELAGHARDHGFLTEMHALEERAFVRVEVSGHE